MCLQKEFEKELGLVLEKFLYKPNTKATRSDMYYKIRELLENFTRRNLNLGADYSNLYFTEDKKEICFLLTTPYRIKIGE